MHRMRLGSHDPPPTEYRSEAVRLILGCGLPFGVGEGYEDYMDMLRVHAPGAVKRDKRSWPEVKRYIQFAELVTEFAGEDVGRIKEFEFGDLDEESPFRCFMDG
ncbi:hypothetical protein HDV00_007536 [Rhizophlyctis rosea]|nr:hypothetical protein HDV00_007536 [Rhizophlyctis rosea]